MRLVSLEKEVNGKKRFLGKISKTYEPPILKGKVILYRQSRKEDCIFRKSNTLSYDVDAVHKAKELGVEYLVTWCSDTKDMFISPIEVFDDPKLRIEDFGEDPSYRLPLTEPHVKTIISERINLGFTSTVIKL